MQCSACHQPAGDGLLCGACGAILPPRPVDEFAALGVARRFDLDPAELETRYRELSRKVHPDRFAKASPRERMLSLQAATTLNQAYRRLKEPLRRAEALLALAGVTIGENERADGELLMEIMELGEALHDARGEGDTATAERVLGDVRARRAAAFAEVERLFAAGGAPADVKRQLIVIRYYDRLLESGAGAPGAEAAL